MVGTVLGPYRIEAEIGRGGMGTVYRATRLDSGQAIAVKVLPPELARQEDFVARFIREIETLKQLQHPHIAAIDSFGEQDGLPYYGMEFVDGRSLDEILRRDRRLDWQQATEVVAQLAQALKHAHDKGIIHRDIKPANILVDILWQVKLTDFGIAKAIDATRLTVTGGIIGTAEYMSPEQAEGRRLDKRSDLYSLGVVYYQMLAGRPPFVGRTATDLMKEHRFGIYEPLRNLAPDVPRPIEQIVDNLLLKDPSQRTPDASILLKQIETARRHIRDRATASAEAPTRVMPAADSRLTPRARREGVTAVLRDLFSRDALAGGTGALAYALRRWGIVLVCLLFLVGLAIYLTRPKGPETLYREAVQWIELARGRGLTVSERSLFLRKAHAIFQTIQAEYPDFPWPAEAHAHREAARRAEREFQEDRDRAINLAIDEVEQRLGEPLRPRRPKSPAREVYEAALELLKAGQPDEGRKKLTAMIDLYADDAEARPWVELARKRLTELDAGLDSAAQKPYEQAMSLVEAGQIEAAVRKLRAIVSLYADDPREKLWVDKAREAIGRLQAGAATPPTTTRARP